MASHIKSKSWPKGWSALAALNVFILLVYLLSHPNFPGDFCAFYTGTQVLYQAPARLYDLDLQRQIERTFMRRDDIPFYHPPYELLLWVPLTHCRFVTAFWVWRAVSLLFLGLASMLLAKTVAPRFGAGSIFIIGMAFFPVPYCLWMGQDSIVLLAAFAGCLWYLARGRDFWAGFALGLGLFKFELVLPIIAVYFLWRRWRFIGGALCSGLAVLSISVAMVGYSGLIQLVHAVLRGQTSQHMAVNPTMMPNIRGLLALIPWLPVLWQLSTVIILSTGLLFLVALVAPDGGDVSRFAAVVCFAILVSYHLNLHDLTLLLFPVLFALQERLWRQLWAVGVPVIILFSTYIYFMVAGTARLALFCIFVAWLWWGIVYTTRQQQRFYLDTVLSVPEVLRPGVTGTLL